jgi:NTP pyrophosphatase (non-canonical NTP hydrolase)
MIDLKKLQKDILQNKIDKWFNTTDVNMEFNLIHGELAEAFESHHKGLWKTWEELADVTIFILWLSEMLWINLEDEIIKKVAINKARKYKKTWEWHTKV